jgi:hypothetical protein
LENKIQERKYIDAADYRVRQKSAYAAHGDWPGGQFVIGTKFALFSLI